GALVKSRIIADCVVVGGQVVEEWLVRDGAGFAVALGMAPADMAAMLVAADRTVLGHSGYFTPARDVAGAYQPRLSDDPVAARYADGWRRIWDEATPAAIRTLYAQGAAVTLPGGGIANGWGEIDRFVIAYLAALPGAAFRVHSLTINRAPDHPVRIAMRWSLDGTHAGHGAFGSPGGAPLHIMGINHAQLWGDRVVAEWILVDEVAVHKQRLDHASHDQFQR
ncbi:MAG: ester cyclase, partial [Sandarakinorhabdus sp.]|nr:ester cyclase [Sandarakinorhabdus sp.]